MLLQRALRSFQNALLHKRLDLLLVLVVSLCNEVSVELSFRYGPQSFNRVLLTEISSVEDELLLVLPCLH